MARRPATPSGASTRSEHDVAHAVEQLRHHCVEAVAPSGEQVVLHVPSGTYLRLEGSASDIVDLLVEFGAAGPAAQALAARYSLPSTQADADVASVVTAITGLQANRASRPRRPTGSGSLHVLRAWLRLPPRRMVADTKAVVAVLAVEVGLRTSDLEQVVRRFRVPLASGSVPATRVDDNANVATLSVREQRHYWAATWALDRWLYGGTCLRRALVTGWFLRRHRPELHLGLIGDGGTSHAWIEAQGMSFNAVPVTGRFASLRPGGAPP
jgi:hypothetical protein